MSEPRWIGLVEPPEAWPYLLKAKKSLQTAWVWDKEDSKRYPINTLCALAQIQTDLSAPKAPKRVRLRILKKPTTFAELVPEKLIKALWEEQHSGTYHAALERAAPADFEKWDESLKAFQSIVRAIEAAYRVNFLGIELLPKPKVNILHQRLQQIAILIGLEGLTRSGFAEFLDRLCPCGLLDHKGAVRKSWARSLKTRRSKS